MDSEEAAPDVAAGVDALTRPLRRLEARDEDVQTGLVQLVLSVVELVRQVLEREAIRRMEAGTLTDDEVERVGSSLMELRQRMDELKEVFGLSDEDLELDLGPLSRML